jgi:hypothetical protein
MTDDYLEFPVLLLRNFSFGQAQTSEVWQQFVRKTPTRNRTSDLLMQDPQYRPRSRYLYRVDSDKRIIFIIPEEQVQDMAILKLPDRRPQETQMTLNRGDLLSSSTLEYSMTTDTFKLEETMNPENELYVLFRSAESLTFEDGKLNPFYTGIDRLVMKFGEEALNIIQGIISLSTFNAEIICATLRCLGTIDDEITHDLRLSILLESLNNKAAKIRDSASLGLVTLKDSKALPALIAARNKEKVKELRKSYDKIIVYLQGA